MLMKQDTFKRPRVAAIGLDQSQIDSIAPLCGTLRTADTLPDYLAAYNWLETDVTILGVENANPIPVPGHVLAIGPVNITWAGHGYPYAHSWPRLEGTRNNTEREVEATEVGMKIFDRLVTELAGQLQSTGEPPTVFQTTNIPGGRAEPLITTTSGKHVALLGMFLYESASDEGWTAMALALPEAAQLSAWLRSFLTILHGVDQDRVPQQPPRLSDPADWYTPEERALAAELAGVGGRNGATRSRSGANQG